MFEVIVRQGDKPPLDVLVSPDNIHLEPAPQSLSDHVNEILAWQREQLLGHFTVDSIPGLDDEIEKAITQHYAHTLGTTVAPFVLIDPVKDGRKVREILGKENMLDDLYLDFLGGSDQSPASPGGSEFHDLVFLHDWRNKYREYNQELINDWGWTVEPDNLESMVRMHVVDLVTHELGHTTFGQRRIEVVFEPELHDKKCIGKLSMRGLGDFEPLKSELGIDEMEYKLEENGYYNGPLWSEGIAAWQSVQVLNSLQNISPDSSPENQASIYGLIKNPDGQKATYGVGYIHSADAFLGLSKAMVAYPELCTVALFYICGRISSKEWAYSIKHIVPENIRRLGYQPTSTAWESFNAWFDLNPVQN